MTAIGTNHSSPELETSPIDEPTSIDTREATVHVEDRKREDETSVAVVDGTMSRTRVVS